MDKEIKVETMQDNVSINDGCIANGKKVDIIVNTIKYSWGINNKVVEGVIKEKNLYLKIGNEWQKAKLSKPDIGEKFKSKGAFTIILIVLGLLYIYNLIMTVMMKDFLGIILGISVGGAISFLLIKKEFKRVYMVGAMLSVAILSLLAIIFLHASVVSFAISTFVLVTLIYYILKEENIYIVKNYPGLYCKILGKKGSNDNE